ncbi:MAG: phenylacetic acid degradation bifunctional protein PaaZ [Dermatophilaceae bacterium]|nr:phenylacetic acid degradation bifunctional protein PaaZ [Actinomycetales bacterium]MBP8881352.1 phenylacetic acid degradation bifunctional protein PaaZ [Dermatophilaceae bacterium]MBP9918101.1 phenylacetic acid degradation bifunctional protein PaaZ [Dermatophilaceae bacterium]
MTHKVSSYIAGAWITPEDEGAPIFDASNGEVVATASSTGVDFEAMIAHARTVGGPALRAMTFTQRGLALKNLAKYLKGRVDEVYADYGVSGATLADARVDVEGGIGVLFVYASKALKELPNDTIIVEGNPENIVDKHQGQTIYTTPDGVAVFINAFNFPVWGMLEKLATAFIAGIPVIVKPATPTAQIAELSFRHIIESGILPEGSVQFVGGSIVGALDHLGGQDAILFTGSAATAARLRTAACVVERGTKFTAEADSVNATILGPDAGVDTEEFSAFVKGIFRELSSKTGQKCTCIRRIFVPPALVEPTVNALLARLGKIVVGDPRVEGTTMGPLVNASQRDDVASSVRALMKGAELRCGGPDIVPTIASGDAERGGFFPPTVLVANDSRAPQIHEVEAFGPVATVIPYTSTDDLVDLVSRGEGSLVASVASHDPAWIRDLMIRIAPYHGRLLILDRENAATAPPHGAALPQLIHGGPGRAGGGAELGGLRSVKHMMQATSISAGPEMMVGLTQVWNPAAEAKPLEVHPFRIYLDDLKLGDTLFTGSRTITLEDIEHFAHFTGDTFYAHMDEEAAAASPIFKGRVAHGYFLLAAAAGLFVDPDPGPVLANFGLENLRFTQPVYPGESIRVRLTCKSKLVRPGTGWGEVTWDVALTNEKDEVVATYQLLTINACRPTE